MYNESLQKLLAEFVEAQRVRRLAADTVDSRRHSVDVFFKYLAGAGVEDIRAVTRQHIRDYQSWLMSQDKYCVHTVHVYLIALRRLFEHLENTDAILVNPCLGLRLPKLPDRLPRNVLTPQEAKAVLQQPDTQTPKGIRDRAILEVFYSTGLRVAEMAALTVHDVDPQNGFVRVNKGKGCKDRVVPMGDTASRYVREYLKEVRSKWTVERREERGLWLSTCKPHRPIGTQIMLLAMQAYGRAAGLAWPLTPHVWRHTCATHMIANGSNVTYVQRLLGHRRLDTTQIYTRVAIPEIKVTYRQSGPRPKATVAPAPKPTRFRPFYHYKAKAPAPVTAPQAAPAPATPTANPGPA
jgi:integrase/recombinase XerD